MEQLRIIFVLSVIVILNLGDCFKINSISDDSEKDSSHQFENQVDGLRSKMLSELMSGSIPDSIQSGCQYSSPAAAGCCLSLDVPLIPALHNRSACVNATLTMQYNATHDVTNAILQYMVILDNEVLVFEEFDFNNPPPVCVGLPYAEHNLGVCTYFRDIRVTQHSSRKNMMTGCITLELEIGIPVAELDVGCFHFAVSLPSKSRKGRERAALYSRYANEDGSP